MKRQTDKKTEIWERKEYRLKGMPKTDLCDGESCDKPTKRQTDRQTKRQNCGKGRIQIETYAKDRSL